MDLNISGIYKITNTINDKAYIGLAKNINKRWKEHKSCDKGETDKNLYWAFNEYGIENFKFEVLKEVPVNKLGYWERKLIEEHDTYRNGYNSSPGGEGSSTKTLSDKYDINYSVKSFDCLKYKLFDQESRKLSIFETKYSKKQTKFDKKLLKHSGNKKKTLKLNTKKDKRLSKIQLKINLWTRLVDEIKTSNAELKDKQYMRMHNYVDMPLTSFDIEPSKMFLKEVNMFALHLRRFQSNYVKYKQASITSAVGEVKFSRKKLIFSPTGFKNTELLYEDLKTIVVEAHNNGYRVIFNNAFNEFKRAEGKYVSSEPVKYPNGNVLWFNNFVDLKLFIVTLRTTMGY